MTEFRTGKTRLWAAASLVMLAGVCLLCVYHCSGAAVSDSGFAGKSLQAPEAQTRDMEEWVAQTSKKGEGAVRYAVGSDSSQDRKSREIRVVTAGPLNSASKRRLETKLRSEIQKYERILDERLASPKTPTSTRDYQEDLEIASKLERVKVEERMVREGTYLTMKNGDPIPPSPPGTLTRQIGAFQMENGEWGDVVFFVALHKHHDLHAIYEALTEVYTHNRKEGIDKFNTRPYSEQREWAERFFKLEARFKEGTADMPAEDIAVYLAMKRELQYLDADIHPEWSILIPRKR